MPSDGPPRLALDLREFAAAIGLHIATVYRWREQGTFPVPIFYIGSSPRVRVSDVEGWLARLAEDASVEQDAAHHRRTPASRRQSEAGVTSIRRAARGSGRS